MFELRNGNQVIYSERIAPWNFKSALKYKGYKVYKLTITDAMLSGVYQKAFDLGYGQIQALITGTDASGNPCVPVTADTANVAKSKGSEAIASPKNDQPTTPGALMPSTEP